MYCSKCEGITSTNCGEWTDYVKNIDVGSDHNHPKEEELQQHVHNVRLRRLLLLQLCREGNSIKLNEMPNALLQSTLLLLISSDVAGDDDDDRITCAFPFGRRNECVRCVRCVPQSTLAFSLQSTQQQVPYNATGFHVYLHLGVFPFLSRGRWFFAASHQSINRQRLCSPPTTDRTSYSNHNQLSL